MGQLYSEENWGTLNYYTNIWAKSLIDETWTRIWRIYKNIMVL